jgi:hypothetical protein
MCQAAPCLLHKAARAHTAARKEQDWIAGRFARKLHQYVQQLSQCVSIYQAFIRRCVCISLGNGREANASWVRFARRLLLATPNSLATTKLV